MSLSQQWQNYTTSNSGLVDNDVKTVLISKDDLKWFGTKQGLSVYDGQTWQTLTTGNGLSNSRINDLALLPGEMPYIVWVATDSGASRLEVHSFDDIRIADSYFASASELISNHVRAVAPDTGLIKWFGTDKGVSVFNDEDWMPLTEDDYLSRNQINDIESDRTGLVHIATRGGGVSRLRMEVDGITSASTINFWSSMPIDTVYTIYIDSNNVQWYGNRQGAFRHEGIDSKLNWTVFRTGNGLIDNCVQSITEDLSGGIWIGTPSGVSYYYSEEFQNYNQSDGLISNDVRDIDVDSQGNIWFATDAGVSLFRKATPVVDTGTFPRSCSLTNYPNPFNHGTILQFRMAEPGYVNLSVISILGKEVRTITGKYYPAGNHRIRWNATDDLGNSMPAGVYFAVMSFADKILTRKLVLLK